MKHMPRWKLQNDRFIERNIIKIMKTVYLVAHILSWTTKSQKKGNRIHLILENNNSHSGKLVCANILLCDGWLSKLKENHTSDKIISNSLDRTLDKESHISCWISRKAKLWSNGRDRVQWGHGCTAFSLNSYLKIICSCLWSS